MIKPYLQHYIQEVIKPYLQHYIPEVIKPYLQHYTQEVIDRTSIPYLHILIESITTIE